MDKMTLSSFWPCNLAQLILVAAYEATLLAAVLNYYSGGTNRVYLTALGSDDTKVQAHLVKEAIETVLPKFTHHGLDIYFVDPSPTIYESWGRSLSHTYNRE